jgi:CO/xanthine dehydrogenase FAD-binding subunit
MSWQMYTLPHSVGEALDALRACPGRARVIAGGTDLLLELRRGQLAVDCLVDITFIKELLQIELIDGQIVIGAGVTHSQGANSNIIQEHATALAEAAAQMGSPQIRNQGTIVGNVVQGLPAADAAVALMAFETEVQIASPEGIWWEPMEGLYQGVGRCKVDSSKEIATRLRFRARSEGEGSAFLRLARRKSLSLPMLNVAVAVGLKEDHFEWARIVLAPVADRPYRARGAEGLLRGQAVNAGLIEIAAEAAQSETEPRSSRLRGSREYRREMARVLTRRALEKAVAVAQGR